MKIIKFALLIPCYESHADTLVENIDKFKSYKIPLIIIDDGSSNLYKQKIKDLEDVSSEIYVFRNDVNLGKGGAVKTAIRQADELGITHGIQVDSDGQHCFDDIGRLIKLSEKYPDYQISGLPVYDKSIPKGRMIGRYITHFWVWVETLSFEIKDSMCGFRSYPIKQTLKVIRESSIGDRMNFDIEILVKMFWSGVSIKYIPVKVTYPEVNTSHFRMFEDNLSISWMHTLLFFQMIPRIPYLIKRKFIKKKWHENKERGSLFLMKFSLWVLLHLPAFCMTVLLRLISLYFYLFSYRARKSSLFYLEHYRDHCQRLNIEPKKITSYQHLNAFASMVSDKFKVWSGKINRSDLCANEVDKLYNFFGVNTGGVFISSHFGNIEVLRSIGQSDSDFKINPLMFTGNSQKVMQVLNDINPQVNERIINVEKIDMSLVGKLDSIFKRGEFVFCMGDRKSVNSEKTIDQQLLGKKIKLPLGPFLLSYLFKVPVFSFHCYKHEESFRIDVKDITPTKGLKRSDYLMELTKNYVKCLESLLMIAPEQWFNFIPYWEEDFEKY